MAHHTGPCMMTIRPCRAMLGSAKNSGLVPGCWASGLLAIYIGLTGDQRLANIDGQKRKFTFASSATFASHWLL
jgi:hypothetical protein